MQHNQVTAPIDQFPNPYIVQVDAGCFPCGVTTAGCVIKDPCGTIILSATKKEMMNTVLALGEALGIRWCLQLAKDEKA